MVSFQIVPRKTPLTESAAPASARPTTARGSDGEKPTKTMATAQIAAAMTTAAPCRFTLEVQPLKIVVHKLPNDIAEYNHPAALAPPQATAIEGKRAIGIANVMATISTTYVPISSGRLTAYLRPSIMLRMPGRAALSLTGILRIAANAMSETMKLTTSIM